MYDELLLVLYTPEFIYFYRHDGNMGLASSGQRTAHEGQQIMLRGPPQEEYWLSSLRAILGVLDSETNGCARLYSMPLTDYRIPSILSRWTESIMPQRIFRNVPLGQCCPNERAMRIQTLVRCVDGILNPHSLISDPAPGYTISGACRSVYTAEYDWCRNGVRIECKSGQLRWEKSSRRWKVVFSSVKVGDVVTPRPFDELLLGFYTPRGIYIFKHDVHFGLFRGGCRTAATGYGIQVYGPRRVSDWMSALDAILAKFDDSGCERIAYVQW